MKTNGIVRSAILFVLVLGAGGRNANCFELSNRLLGEAALASSVGAALVWSEFVGRSIEQPFSIPPGVPRAKSDTLDSVGDVAVYAVILAPATATAVAYFNTFSPGDDDMDGDDLDTALSESLRHTSTLFAAILAKDLLKNLFSRPRPYVEYQSPVDDSADAYRSFPSGHTTIAWAMFGESLYRSLRNPSIYSTVVSIAAGAAAGTVSLLRVLSGAHYPGDVITGALLGFAVGLAMQTIRFLDRVE